MAATENGKRVLVLFDLAEVPPDDHCYDDDLEHEDWRSEADVVRSLRALGHKPKLFGIYDKLQPLIDELSTGSYDSVFNLAEAFRGERQLEANIAAVLELLPVSFTGAGPIALRLCKDKALSKEILSYHGIPTPAFQVSRKVCPLMKVIVSLPAIVKPLCLESSLGIAQESFVRNAQECLDRIRFVHERLGQDAIIEEYIPGREIYISLLGRGDVEVFPPRELIFGQVAEGEPTIATFKAKWDDEYRKRWGIRSDAAAHLSPSVEARLVETAKAAYRALQIDGYARVDFRVTAAGTPVFIEANPNPSIAMEDDFAQSALRSNLSYDELISKILRLAD